MANSCELRLVSVAEAQVAYRQRVAQLKVLEQLAGRLTEEVVRRCRPRWLDLDRVGWDDEPWGRLIFMHKPVHGRIAESVCKRFVIERRNARSCSCYLACEYGHRSETQAYGGRGGTARRGPRPEIPASRYALYSRIWTGSSIGRAVDIDWSFEYLSGGCRSLTGFTPEDTAAQPAL